jgi:galacturonosyltransferase
VIQYHGLLKDTRVLLKDMHCVIHPTYYPEGMSNVLLEGAATGRAIISTDRAGCRETIDHGVNGYIVQEQNSEELITAVERFVNLSYEEKRAMGLAGRAKMEREFDRGIVVRRYLDTVAELTAKRE